MHIPAHSSILNPTNYGHVMFIASAGVATTAISLFLTLNLSPLPTALLAGGSGSLFIISLMLYGIGRQQKTVEEEGAAQDNPPPEIRDDPPAREVVRNPPSHTGGPRAVQQPKESISEWVPGNSSGKWVPDTSSSNGATNELNVRIFKETEEVCQKGRYTMPGWEFSVEVDTKRVLQTTQIYNDSVTPIPKSAKKHNRGTHFSVIEGDTLDVAIKVGNETGEIPLALSMANARHKGGGYKQGAKAQEESIIRRTNLILSLDKADKENGYPFAETGGIYSGSVEVFRDAKGVPFDRTYEIGVISVAGYSLKHKSGYDCKHLGHTGANTAEALRSNKTYMKGMEGKIKNMLRTAYANGHKHLVLGALGCGDFANPPELVAEIFAKVFKDNEFKNIFASVTFAIYISRDTPEKQKRDSKNIVEFKNQFNKLSY